MIFAQAVPESLGPWMFFTSLVLTGGTSIIVTLIRYLPNRTRIIATCTDGSRKATVNGEPGMTLTQALIEALNIRAGLVDLKESIGELAKETKTRNDIITSLDAKTDANRKAMHDEYRDAIHTINNIGQTTHSNIQMLTLRLDQFLLQPTEKKPNT